MVTANLQSRAQSIREVTAEAIVNTIISRQQVRDRSIFEITTASLNPADQGVNSLRLGLDPTKVCITCGQRDECPGHDARLEFPSAIINPLFPRDVIRALKIFCRNCGEPVLSDEEIDALAVGTRGGALTRKIEKASEGRRCTRPAPVLPGGIVSECSSKAIHYYKYDLSKQNGQITYTLSPKSDVLLVMPTEEVDLTLSAISQVNATRTGYGESHPRDLVLRNLLVFTGQQRAAIKRGNTDEQHYLTTTYVSIYNASQAVKRAKENPKIGESVSAAEKVLYTRIRDLYTNDKEQAMTIQRLLNGKKGLWRMQVSAGRQNFAGRTVLAPEVDLPIGWITAPEEWDEIMQQEEVVTPWNRVVMQRFMDEGEILSVKTPYNAHSSSIDRAKQGKFFPISHLDNKILHVGQIIRRKMRDGDVLLHNRQPTLHHGGIRQIRVKKSPAPTLGHNPIYHRIYNSDYDGDEGSLLPVHATRAIVTALILQGFDQMIISQHTNRPSIGLVYDTIQGINRMTMPDTILSEDFFWDLYSSIGGGVVRTGGDSEGVRRETEAATALTDLKSEVSIAGRGRLPPARFRRGTLVPFSGMMLFSALFPADFYYRKDDVLIVNGTILRGPVKASHVGVDEDNTIIQAMYQFYGADRTGRFIMEASRVGIAFITRYGATVGIGSTFTGGDQATLEKQIGTALTSIRKTVSEIDARTPLIRGYQDRLIEDGLSTIAGLGVKMLANDINPSNGFRIAAQSGAKGSSASLVQVSKFTGQALISGSRPAAVLPLGNAHFAFDADPLDFEGRGLSLRSYRQGFSPEALFYASAATRANIVMMQSATPVSGDMAHLMMKAFDGVAIAEDYTVRDATDRIIELVYGGDGFETRETISIPDVDGKSFPSFIDIEATVALLNAAVGWIPAELGGTAEAALADNYITIATVGRTPELDEKQDMIMGYVDDLKRQSKRPPSAGETAQTIEVSSRLSELDDIIKVSTDPVVQDDAAAQREALQKYLAPDTDGLLIPWLPLRVIGTTRPWEVPGLSRYQKAAAIGMRAEMLNSGEVPLVEIDENEHLPTTDLAIREYHAGVLPISVQAVLPNGDIKNTDCWDKDRIHIPVARKITLPPGREAAAEWGVLFPTR